MDSLHIEKYTEEELERVASRLIAVAGEETFWAFYGSMGVGKTTLIKEVCRQLGVEGNVCSPSFAIVNTYATEKGENIYHFDFYRMKQIEEAYDIGYEEYFYSGCRCLVEWPEQVEPLLPDPHVRIDLDEAAGKRSLTAYIVTRQTNKRL